MDNSNIGFMALKNVILNKRFHYIKEKIDGSLFNIKYYFGDHQVTIFFTMPLSKNKFQKSINTLI